MLIAGRQFLCRRIGVQASRILTSLSGSARTKAFFISNLHPFLCCKAVVHLFINCAEKWSTTGKSRYSVQSSEIFSIIPLGLSNAHYFHLGEQLYGRPIRPSRSCGPLSTGASSWMTRFNAKNFCKAFAKWSKRTSTGSCVRCRTLSEACCARNERTMVNLTVTVNS